MTALYLLIWMFGCVGVGYGIFEKHYGVLAMGSFAMLAAGTGFLGFQRALGMWLLAIGVVWLLDWVGGRR